MEITKSEIVGIGPSEVEISGWPFVVFVYLIYKAFVVLVTGKVKIHTTVTFHK